MRNRDHCGHAPVLVESLEDRRLLAARVFFQDFDDPANHWKTGRDKFMTADETYVRRTVVCPGPGVNATFQDDCMLRGNWGRRVTDRITGLTANETDIPGDRSPNEVRYTYVAIDAASRGVRHEILLQHWVWFDPGVEAAPSNNIKFAWFNGGHREAEDFDWFLDLEGRNFNTFRLLNNSNGRVGGPSVGRANFSDAPGAGALLGGMSARDWFRGRWHSVQIHMKLNTADNRADGVFRFWLDGIKVLDVRNVDFRNSTADTFREILPLGMHGGPIAPGTSFGWQLDEVELWDGLATGAPLVSGVFVRGQSWRQDFLNYLAARGLGDRSIGFAIRGGAAQLDELPWLGVNQVAIRFEEIVQVGRADLRISGANGLSRAVTGFRYDGATRTAVWTLGTSLGADRILLDLDDARVNRAGTALDGDWTNGSDSFPSGNGTAGRDFELRLNVLPGDTDRSGLVNALDIADVKRRSNRTAANPGTGSGAYSVFADVTADGLINALDMAAVKQRLNSRLPVASAASLLGEFPKGTNFAKSGLLDRRDAVTP